MTTQIVYLDEKVSIQNDYADMLNQKEAATNALVAMNNQMNINGGVIDMSKLKKLQTKIMRLNKKIGQTVQLA